MDEFGVKLINLNDRIDSLSDKIGQFLVNALLKVLKSLTVVGAIALLLVSGGIFVHNLPFLHHLLPSVPGLIVEFLLGLVVGFIALLVYKGGKRLFIKK